jgi:hypothetical protein
MKTIVVALLVLWAFGVQAATNSCEQAVLLDVDVVRVKAEGYVCKVFEEQTTNLGGAYRVDRVSTGKHVFLKGHPAKLAEGEAATCYAYRDGTVEVGEKKRVLPLYVFCRKK